MIELTAAQLAAAYLNLQHVDGDARTVELRLKGDELVAAYFTDDGPALTVRVDRDGTASRTLTVD